MPIMSSLLKFVVEERGTLAREQARAVLGEILAGGEGAGDVEIASLLTAMAVRGETSAELAGFAEAMRGAAVPLPLEEEERALLVDTCGTGGDGLGTFNISTGAALVAAAAGAKVAKHGNRAVTSKCGSADVLEVLGVPVGLGAEGAVACLRATGFMFLLATGLQPAMRRVAGVRRGLGFRTIFNLAGPLTNPAGARAQVMGVWAESKVGVVAEAMGMLGVRHAFVVHGEGGSGGQGLDELTVTGVSRVAEVRGAVSGPTVRRFMLQPEELGLGRVSVAELGGGGSAEESAAVLLGIFRGEERGGRREIVLLNAAAALVAGGVAADWREGLVRAGEAVDSGAVMEVLAGLRAFERAG
jgi:anthranilate phosphoribosyltransferase